MPIYMCNAVKGAISTAAKAKIASDITDIHCKVTGAPPTFVHVFFFEDAPQHPLDGKCVFLFGSIRSGRTPDQKRSLVDQMKQSIHGRSGVPMGEISVDTADVPASWVMEGGDVLPEPGEEENWLKAHDITTT